MSLEKFMSPEDPVILTIYNTVSKGVERGVRDALGITVDPRDLKANIDLLLRDGYKAVSLRDVISGKAGPDSFALVACDGYDLSGKDGVLEHAKMKNAPLAFAIPTALVGENRPSWTNQIEIALEEALKHKEGKGSIVLQIPGNHNLAIFRDAASARQARNKLKYLKPKAQDGHAYVARICELLSKEVGVEIKPRQVSDSPFDRKMTWDQMKDLSEQGHEMVLMGHAHSRPYIAMTDGMIRRDIGRADDLLMRSAGAESDILFYPEGQYNERVMKAAYDSGIEAGITMNRGVVLPSSDRMELPSYTITQQDLELDR